MVTATRVKMVMMGDTTIYNAEAFLLAEGSMLDNLIRQLPGMELRAGGQILLNGRPVSSLLVNGEDFFRGYPKAALDNMPAYMVEQLLVHAHRRRVPPCGKNREGNGQVPHQVHARRGASRRPIRLHSPHAQRAGTHRDALQRGAPLRPFPRHIPPQPRAEEKAKKKQ